MRARDGSPVGSGRQCSLEETTASIEPPEAAIASTRTVLAGVSRAQLKDQTPSEKWTVAVLIDHVVGDQLDVSGEASIEALNVVEGISAPPSTPRRDSV